MIRFESTGGIARIVLDTPETGNKFTYALMNDFIDALHRSKESGAVVLVISATGEHFTLGRDQSERLAHVSRRDSLKLILKANSLLHAFPGVSIAAIQGRAMGFGSGLAVQSDISIGTASSTYGFDEIRHGLAPLVVLDYLPRYVGPKVARELIFTGRDFAAQEAQKLGLLNSVVADDAVQGAVERLVRDLTGFSSGALRLIKAFGADLAASGAEDAGLYAVERLAEWLEGGRPEIPS